MHGNAPCVFVLVLTLPMTKSQLERQKAATKCDDCHAAAEVPPPSLAFLSSVKPSAAICGHYPGDQTETQTDSTCSEAVRQGLLKDAPLKPPSQTDSTMIRRPACKQTRKSNQGILFLLHNFSLTRVWVQYSRRSAAQIEAAAAHCGNKNAWQTLGWCESGLVGVMQGSPWENMKKNSTQLNYSSWVFLMPLVLIALRQYRQRELTLRLEGQLKKLLLWRRGETSARSRVQVQLP